MDENGLVPAKVSSLPKKMPCRNGEEKQQLRDSLRKKERKKFKVLDEGEQIYLTRRADKLQESRENENLQRFSRQTVVP